MDFNYTKIKIGNWLFKNCFPIYNMTYARFKLKNDAHEIELMKQIIKPGFHILDIGANIGFYAKLISQMTRNSGQVYCFEPDSINYQYLIKNTKGIENIKCFNLAVSDKKETIKVYKSKLLNVDHRTYPVNNYDTVEEIGADSIDNLIQSGEIKKVDFIKIDIQGFELTAFKGMQKLLSENNHIKILAEYWPHGFKRASTSAIEFYDFFDKMNYQFRLIDNNKLNVITREYIVENNDKPFEFSFNVLIEKKS
jgi:FkbM family methyltransferase